MSTPKRLFALGSYSVPIGEWSNARSWYVLNTTLSATMPAACYYDRRIASWVVFAIDDNGQQDGDAVYCTHRSGIRQAQRTLTRWA